MISQLASYISFLKRKQIKQISSKNLSSIFCLTFFFMSLVLCTEAATREVLLTILTGKEWCFTQFSTKMAG